MNHMIYLASKFHALIFSRVMSGSPNLFLAYLYIRGTLEIYKSGSACV